MTLQTTQLQPLSTSEVVRALEQARLARLAATERGNQLAPRCREAEETLRRASRERVPAAQRRELAQRARTAQQEHGQAQNDFLEADELLKALENYRTLHREGRLEGRPPTHLEAEVLGRFGAAGGVVDHWFWAFEAPRDENLWRYVAAGSLWASVLRAGFQDVWPDLALPAERSRLGAKEFLQQYKRAVKHPPYRLKRGSHPNELCEALIERVLRGVPPDAALYAWSDEHGYFNAGKEWWGTLFVTLEVPGGAVGIVASSTD